jgi:CheY-like chemotaxis protein
MASSVPNPKPYGEQYPGEFPPGYSVSQSDKAGRGRENMRIVIVDDDPFFRSLLKVMIQQVALPNPEILEAEDSRMALSICQSKSVDLVFCDLHLPAFRSKNGLEVIKELRQINPVVPVYMVTAENSDAIAGKALAVGATGHILKPVSLHILRRIMLSLQVDSEVN